MCVCLAANFHESWSFNTSPATLDPAEPGEHVRTGATLSWSFLQGPFFLLKYVPWIKAIKYENGFLTCTKSGTWKTQRWPGIQSIATTCARLTLRHSWMFDCKHVHHPRRKQEKADLGTADMCHEHRKLWSLGRSEGQRCWSWVIVLSVQVFAVIPQVPRKRGAGNFAWVERDWGVELAGACWVIVTGVIVPSWACCTCSCLLLQIRQVVCRFNVWCCCVCSWRCVLHTLSLGKAAVELPPQHPERRESCKPKNNCMQFQTQNTELWNDLQSFSWQTNKIMLLRQACNSCREHIHMYYIHNIKNGRYSQTAESCVCSFCKSNRHCLNQTARFQGHSLQHKQSPSCPILWIMFACIQHPVINQSMQ